MKKVLILLLVVTAHFATAQTFAPIGAKWHYNSDNGGGGPPRSAYHLYEAVGDSIIEGINCRKIAVTRFPPSSNDSIIMPPIFVYESGDTVYYYHRVLLRFSPLYIFSAAVGDTLTFDSPDEFGMSNQPFVWRARIDSISDYIIGNDTLKMFWPRTIVTGFDPSADFHGPYIKRIGGTFQFMHQPWSIFPEWDGPLRCYTDNSMFADFMNIPCTQRAGLSVDETNTLAGIRIYPNPAYDFLRLENNQSTSVNYQLRDLQGRIINSGTLAPNNTQQLELQGMPKGIYLLQLESGDLVRQEKVVVGR